MLLLRILNLFYEFFSLAILIRVILSWIPNINYYKEPIKTLYKVTDLILEPIRSMLDKYGLLTVIDISPVIALFLLRLAYKLLARIILF